MGKRNVWISPHPDGWKVHRENSERASRIIPTKSDAVEVGRDIARRERVEIVIQRRDGTIQQKDSYGNDEFPPRG
jgi:hypothetical protein